MSLNNKDVTEKLKLINYPGFSRDIVSFGMVKDITISNSEINIILSQSTTDEKILKQIKITNIGNSDIDISGYYLETSVNGIRKISPLSGVDNGVNNNNGFIF